MRNEATSSKQGLRRMGKAREWRAERLKQKENFKSVRIDLSKTISSTDPSKPGRGPDLEERWPGAMRDACYVEQRCLAILMSADAMGQCLILGRWFWGATDKSTWLRREKCRSSDDLGWQAADSTGRAARGRGRERASEAEWESVGVWRAIRGGAEACSQARRRCHVVDIARF